MGFESEPQATRAERGVEQKESNLFAALPVEFKELPKKAEPETEKPKPADKAPPVETEKPRTQIVLMNETAARTGKPLYTGDTITREKDGLKVTMPNGDTLTVNTTTGKYDLQTKDKVDIRSKYKGTEWEETSIKYPGGDVIDIDTKGIDSIIRGQKGILFGRNAPGGPPESSVDDLKRLFGKHGKAELGTAAEKNDKAAQQIRDEAFKNDRWGPREATALSGTYIKKAELVQEAAKLDPKNRDRYSVETEGLLRQAVDSLGREIKEDSVESIPATAALKKFLESIPNHEAKEVAELAAKVERAKVSDGAKK